MVFTRLAHGVIRRPIVAIVVWAMLVVAGLAVAMLGVTGEALFDRVDSGAPVATGSDSARADHVIADGQDYSQNVNFLVTNVNLSDPETLNALARAMATLRADLAQIEGVAQIPGSGHPWVLDPLNPSFCADPSAINPTMCALENAHAAAMIAGDGQGIELTVNIAKDLDPDAEAQAVANVIGRMKLAQEELPQQVPGAKTLVGGTQLIVNELVSQMKTDLAVGEVVALPVAMIVMVVVFAGFLAAAMPIIGAIASITVTLGLLWVLSYVTDLHTSVINVITALGLGLSIDYGLLMVSRFREEMARLPATDQATDPGRGGRTERTQQAIMATIPTAGRTVFYSATTIAVCVAGLLAFDPSLLRVFGLSGLIVVLLALATAITLVPAILTLLGERAAKASPLTRIPGLRRLLGAGARETESKVKTKTTSSKTNTKAANGKTAKQADGSAAQTPANNDPEHRWLARLADWVQGRPWWVIGGVVLVLAVLAVPVGHMEIRNYGVDMLPDSSPQRAFLAELERNYLAFMPGDIQVLSLGGADATSQWAAENLEAIDGATPRPLGEDGRLAIQSVGYSVVQMSLGELDPEGAEARHAVRQIRALPQPDYELLVTGPAARLVDYQDELVSGAPLAALIIVLAAFCLLFAMTGSVFVPIKAIITNMLSLLASLGVVTWIFQDGNLTGLLNFHQMPGIDSTIVVMLLIFGFGLAIDYEVFLISRIKEEWDADPDPRRAVSLGLQHSGRIITSAALIIVVVFIGFAAGKLLMIKQIGVGLAFAVTLDATLVRLLLVPATMTVLGKWNWWSPPFMQAIHRQIARLR